MVPNLLKPRARASGLSVGEFLVNTQHLRWGHRTAMSERSKPLHWIFSPFSWPPTSSRQCTMFSTWTNIYHTVSHRSRNHFTIMFSSVRKANRGQWRNTAELRLLSTKLIRQSQSIWSLPWVIAAKKHSLQVRATVGNGGQLLVAWTAVENFRKFCHCGTWIAISKHLMQVSF